MQHSFAIVQTENCKKQRDISYAILCIFGIIVIVIIIISVSHFVYQKYKKIIKDLRDDKKEIIEIKKSLNYKDLFNSMDVRLKVLEKLIEKRNRRAQIDPRIIWIIVLLILLYLFLKSMGFLP